MATIKCTIQEYHRFIGPIIRNKINSLARKIRNEKNGICEFCGEKNILEAAHVHGKGRKNIIENVLKEYLINEYIQGDLLEIEIKILNAHEPIENAFKFLCKNCHTEYDKNEIVMKNPIFNKEKNNSFHENNEFKKINRIKLWSKRNGQINHNIIKAYLEISKNQKVTYENLKKKCISEKFNIDNDKFYGHFSSMKTDKGNSHGKVFYEKNGYVEIYPTVMNEIKRYFTDI